MKQDWPPFILADGAMGTELIRQEGSASILPAAKNLSAPQRVRRIHAAYRDAGAQMLTTNTFCANSIFLARWRMAEKVSAINAAGVRLAREEARSALVAGSIGPAGEQRSLPSMGRLRRVFRQQAAVLHEEGVDLFLCETFGQSGELRAAIEGIREVSDRPIVAQMVFLRTGRTPDGKTPVELIAAMEQLPIDALGVNCAVGTETIKNAIFALAAGTDLPLIARPNAGQPELRGRAWQYPMSAKQFGDLAARLAPHVRIFGGCCGTTPEHIAQARKRLA